MARILIVDDDRDLVEAVVQVLSSAGHETTTAFDGGEGLDECVRRIPDALILDIEMPLLDGPGMLRRVRDIEPSGPTLPVVLASGVPRLAEIAESLGSAFYLRKPFSAEQLIDAVQCALGAQR